MSSIENSTTKATVDRPETDRAETPEVENLNHTYRTHRIPWFIHVLWVGFWVLAIWYVLTFQVPVLLNEIKSPP